MQVRLASRVNLNSNRLGVQFPVFRVFAGAGRGTVSEMLCMMLRMMTNRSHECARSGPSNAKMRAYHFVRQLANRTGSDPAALVENAELAGHTARKRQLLLDQQHGQAFFLV